MVIRPCGLVVRLPGYRSRGPGSILGATGFSEKQWDEVMGRWRELHNELLRDLYPSTDIIAIIDSRRMSTDLSVPTRTYACA
jgi:hypothetical protein